LYYFRELGVVIEEFLGIGPLLESNEGNEGPIDDSRPMLIAFLRLGFAEGNERLCAPL
jgi:hypothetical protein